METSTLSTPQSTFTTPDWVQDAVFYQIFPDRFARSLQVPKPANLEPWDSPPTTYGFKGGDLLGVVEHLDYLQELGINAIYFTPVFSSAANHRYHTHDYYQVDPILGGNAALTTLLKEAHRHGMRVVLDGVFNHASRSFYQFAHLLENGLASPYIDWFHAYSWPLHPYPTGGEAPGYDCWWGLPALPKFQTGTPAVREFLWGVAEHWMREGIDGWRLDVPNEIDDDEFWREFRRRVKAINPQGYIVGEIWGDARRWLQGDQFDAVMNYLFTRACLGFFASHGTGLDDSVIGGTGLSPVDRLDAAEFRSSVDALLQLYPWPATLAQLNLLDSHDTPRFLTAACRDDSSLRLATLFQMTIPGAPCIFYGDEIGIQGGHDPDCRQSFPWDRGLWNRSLRDYVKRCITLRHAAPVLRRGSFTSLYGQDGVFVFQRTLGDNVALVGLNAGKESASVDITLPPGTHLSEFQAVWAEEAPALSEGRLRAWRLAARSGDVLLGASRPGAAP